MTYQISDIPMRTKPKRRSRVEYWVYFTLIFMFLLPAVFVKRVFERIMMSGIAHENGVVRQASRDAHTAASLVFSA